jgi:hypothetical protein
MKLSRLPSLAAASLLAAGLCSCSTSPAPEPVFRFHVLLYRPPVEVSKWEADPSLAADPEGAALNAMKAMQRGDFDAWLSNWQPSERPAATAAERQAFRQQGQSLRGVGVNLLGRVVADAQVVVEFSFSGPKAPPGNFQIPLQRADGRWWFTAIDPASEYMHWETATNKIVEYMDPNAFGKHMDAARGSPSN